MGFQGDEEKAPLMVQAKLASEKSPKSTVRKLYKLLTFVH